MKLLTEELTKKLRKNGEESRASDEGIDHFPVVKFFHPLSPAKWLLTELDEDGDTLFGLADLGMGFPELGYVSLRELEGVRVVGLAIERDLYFEAEFPLSVYADAARQHRQIVEGKEELEEAA